METATAQPTVTLLSTTTATSIAVADVSNGVFKLLGGCELVFKIYQIEVKDDKCHSAKMTHSELSKFSEYVRKSHS